MNFKEQNKRYSISTALMHLSVFGIYTLIYLFAFNQVENREIDIYIIDLPVDKAIPFLPIFIIPYILWFFYVAYFIMFYLNRDLTEYYRLGSFLAAGMTVFIIVSIIFPNGLNLRPEFSSLNDNSFLTGLIKGLYLKDTATNVFPSIHVYNTIGIMISYFFNKNKLYFSIIHKNIIIILGVLIILSTMFVKQHSIIDVIGGFTMSYLFYKLFYNEKYTELLKRIGLKGIPYKSDDRRFKEEN